MHSVFSNYFDQLQIPQVWKECGVSLTFTDSIVQTRRSSHLGHKAGQRELNWESGGNLFPVCDGCLMVGVEATSDLIPRRHSLVIQAKDIDSRVK